MSIPLLCSVLNAPAPAQPNLAGVAQIKLALERLNVLGSVLMIAAHPDDENTAVLTYLSRGRKFRTAYLSLTRGEGGQNLIGPELGDLLGLIRTQELLAARRIDGAEQYFTRAIDFGFSKTAEETLTKWGHDAILADVVWRIRLFRPDVVVQVFSGTPRDGHGQHQASGILSREAFRAAADKSRFPEQLRWVLPWQAKRLMQSGFFRPSSGTTAQGIDIDTGTFDTLLGFSYAEIAGMSRSMHRTQGMGSPEQRGAASAFLTYLAGEPVKRDIFDGIDATWNRVPGGAAVGAILSEANREFRPEQPEKTVPLLLGARPLIAAIRDPWAAIKLGELDSAIALCSGLWLDATAETNSVVPGGSLQVDVETLDRSQTPLVLKSVTLEGIPGVAAAESTPSSLPYNKPVRHSFRVEVPPDQPYSQPYWLRKPHNANIYDVDEQELIGRPESPPLLSARFRIGVDSQELELVRPVVRRYVDRVAGEVARPVVVVPPVAIRIAEPVLLFPDGKEKQVEVLLRGNVPAASGELRLEAPAGWRLQPAATNFRLGDAEEETTLAFTVTPPAGSARAELRAIAKVGGREVFSGMQVVAYPDIPPQTVFPPSTAELIRTDVKIQAHRIGYVMGAGDEGPRALRQLGCDVTLLEPGDLAREDLGRFDAIVLGVRAYNVRPDLRSNQQRLLDYMQAGGTVVVQYNVADGRSPEAVAKVGPYPLRLGRDRVTVEQAPVTFLDPASPLLLRPNKISQEDFQGWVQERGLYFAAQWDSHYEPLFECHDPGEAPLRGATLYARFGKGAYIFTAFSWFRQLPAGVPGAFRIFANFLSAGKTAP